jgi:AbrB family looped-hinge helix DNA binding protein
MLGKLTTTVSTKGQVILPKSVRDRLQWEPGTRLLVEDMEGGVRLSAAPLFPPTRPEDVFGCLQCQGPPVSVEDMDAAIAEEVKRRHDRGRY